LIIFINSKPKYEEIKTKKQSYFFEKDNKFVNETKIRSIENNLFMAIDNYSLFPVYFSIEYSNNNLSMIRRE